MARQTAAYHPTESFSEILKGEKQVNRNLFPDVFLKGTNLVIPPTLHLHIQGQHVWLGKTIPYTNALSQEVGWNLDYALVLKLCTQVLPLPIGTAFVSLSHGCCLGWRRWGLPNKVSSTTVSLKLTKSSLVLQVSLMSSLTQTTETAFYLHCIHTKLFSTTYKIFCKVASSPFAVQHAAYDLVTQGYLTVMSSSVLQENGTEEAQGRSGESEVKGTCDPVPK